VFSKPPITRRLVAVPVGLLSVKYCPVVLEYSHTPSLAIDLIAVVGAPD